MAWQELKQPLYVWLEGGGGRTGGGRNLALSASAPFFLASLFSTFLIAKYEALLRDLTKLFLPLPTISGLPPPLSSRPSPVAIPLPILPGSPPPTVELYNFTSGFSVPLFTKHMEINEVLWKTKLAWQWLFSSLISSVTLEINQLYHPLTFLQSFPKVELALTSSVSLLSRDHILINLRGYQWSQIGQPLLTNWQTVITPLSIVYCYE